MDPEQTVWMSHGDKVTMEPSSKSDFYSNFAEKYKERIKNAIKITR